MMGSFLRYLFLTTGISFILYSCIKKTTYDTTPQIEYKAFYPYTGDSADIQIKFTDGDGDIGVKVTDTTQTLFLTYYYQDSSTLKYHAYFSPLFNDTLRTGYVIRAPKDSYNGKPISGELSVRLQQYRHSVRIKNVKYVIYLMDNARHKSQLITTPVLPVLP